MTSLDHFYSTQNPYVVSPYSYSALDWFSYDDPVSASAKAQHALDRGLGGVFAWSVDTDDFGDVCGDGVNPIMTEIVTVRS